MPMTATARATLLDGARALDRSKAPGRRDPTVPYMVYLETRDSAFATIASAWSPAGTAPYPELQALVALRRGDTAAAARLAQSFPSPDSLRRAALGMTGLRTVARATVMAELGDVRRAVALYETIDPKRFAQTSVPETSWPMYVRSHAARARLYEAIGERERAIAAYERFLTLWKDADAPLQPQLREAREALARLRDAGTPVKAVVR
jgi:tetratricopeptide (TPR) repeat protein